MIVYKLDVVNGVAVSLKGFWMVRQNDLANSQLPRLSFESKNQILGCATSLRADSSVFIHVVSHSFERLHTEHTYISSET